MEIRVHQITKIKHLGKSPKATVSAIKFSKHVFITSKNSFCYIQILYLQPIITQYFIDNKSEIWLLFLIAHSKR